MGIGRDTLSLILYSVSYQDHPGMSTKRQVNWPGSGWVLFRRFNYPG